MAEIKCAHCGQTHEQATKFCPKTGKQMGPSAGAKATMIMYATPPSNGSAGHRPVRVNTPPAVRTATPVPGNITRGIATPLPRTPSPATGTTSALGERLSRMTPGVGIRVPEVPPPPVTVDNVPPPVPAAATPVPGADPKRSSRPGSLPDWVVTADPTSTATTSAVFPAAGAPAKGIVHLLKDALKLYRRHARDFLRTAAILFLPGALISSAALTAITAPMRASTATLEHAVATGTIADGTAAAAALSGLLATVLGLLGWAVVAFIVFGLVVPLTLGALSIAVADRALGGDAGPFDYWRLLLGRLGPLLSALAPAALLCAVGYFCAILPGVLLSFLFTFVPAVVLIEGQGGLGALKRSVRLVRADWMRVAVVLIVFGVLNFLAHLIGGALIPDRVFFLGRVLGDLLTLALLPIPALASVLLYLDVRRKTEGLTHEALQAELEALRTAPEPEGEYELG